jgi:hypothetical protein
MEVLKVKVGCDIFKNKRINCRFLKIIHCSNNSVTYYMSWRLKSLLDTVHDYSVLFKWELAFYSHDCISSLRVELCTSCLKECSCLIYVICMCLFILVSNTYCVVFFVLFFFVLCTLCCQFLSIVHFDCPIGIL